MITAQNITEKIILARGKKAQVTLVGNEFVIQDVTDLKSIMGSGDPNNYQEYFRLGVSLNKSTFFTGETLRVSVDMEYLLLDPATVPMVFGVFVQVPTGDIVTAFPVPVSNPGMRIAYAAPFGNNMEWETGHRYQDELVSALFDTAWQSQITPLTFDPAYPFGQYRVMVISFLLWENELYAISWDEKTCNYISVPEPVYSLPQLDRPIFQDHLRLEVADLDLLARLPRASTALGLAITTAGQNGIIGGLELNTAIDERGEYVYISPGIGTLYGRIDDVLGSHPIIVTDPVKVGYFSAHIPPSGTTRFDPIALGLSVISEGTDPGSAGDPRIMIYPETIDPSTGRPKRELQTVPTRSKYMVTASWMTGSADQSTAESIPAPANSMIVGYVINGETKSVYNKAYAPIVLHQHRTATVLDHPDRSVQSRHVETGVIGEFTPGYDLSLKKISDEIMGARGNKSSINERLEAIITEDGTIVEEPIVELIDERLTNLFSGVVDSKGNLLPSALTGSGMLAKMAAVMGVVPHAQYVQLPGGFSQDQCSWIVGMSQFAFSPGSQNTPALTILLQCYCTGRMVTCQSVVKYSNTIERTLPGSANFLTIGWESN